MTKQPKAALQFLISERLEGISKPTLDDMGEALSVAHTLYCTQHGLDQKEVDAVYGAIAKEDDRNNVTVAKKLLAAVKIVKDDADINYLTYKVMPRIYGLEEIPNPTKSISKDEFLVSGAVESLEAAREKAQPKKKK